MLRITEIKLPIEQADTLKHQDDQIKAALLKRLGITESDLIHFSIFKRGVDCVNCCINSSTSSNNFPKI